MFLSLHFYQNEPFVQKVEILFFLISLFGLGTWTEYSPSFSKGNLNFLSHNSRMYAILAFLEVSKLIFTFFFWFSWCIIICIWRKWTIDLCMDELQLNQNCIHFIQFKTIFISKLCCLYVALSVCKIH